MKNIKDLFSNIQLKYIAFFSIIALLSITAAIKVPCPVCGGTGEVSKAIGMENVRIVDIKYKQTFLNMDFCLGYILYKYNVSLTLSNSGSEDAVGWVKVVLKGKYEGPEAVSNVYDVKYIGIEIPAMKTVNDTFNVWFQTAYDVPLAYSVDAMVEEGAVECLACDGSGSIRSNAWFVANGLKGSLEQVTRTEQEFEPPPWVEPTPPEGE